MKVVKAQGILEVVSLFENGLLTAEYIEHAIGRLDRGGYDGSGNIAHAAL